MKVKDLIKELKKVDGELEVELDTMEGESILGLDHVYESTGNTIVLYASIFNMDNN